MKCYLLLSIFFIAKVFSHKNHVVDEKKTFVHSLGSLGSAKCLIEESAWTQREVYSFRDIKYAEPPTGYYRFRPTPIITKFDTEPYDATEYRKSCVNTSLGTTQNTIDETILDCLYLAVHTPKLQGNLPVMVYITGFDLLHGSNKEADPGFFMERDIVLVSIQYRVGVFGFFNANTPSIPGNGGIHDILTALRWIRKYISLFGGNPNLVTLFGQYKVAGIIQLLTMIPEADGLFHKIICQSGSVFTENIFSFSTAAISTQIGIMLGCPNILNAKKLSDCILGASITDLNFLFWEYLKNHNGNTGLVTVGAVGGLIPYMAYESKRRGRIRSYPVIIGIVENPATYILDAFFPGQLSIFSRNQLYPIGGFDLQGEEYQHSLLDRISLEDKKMRKNLKSGINLSSPSKRYVYTFRYRSGKHYLDRKSGNPLRDVTLLDDNMFLFPKAQLTSKDDLEVAKQMVDFWTNFATDGVPKSESLGEWPRYEDGDTKFLVIDKNLRIENDFQQYIEPSLDEA